MSLLNGSGSPKKRKVVQVILLSGAEFKTYVDVKAKFHEVFNAVVIQLGLRETEYFGLSLLKDGEHHFVNLDEKIHKQATKGWKSGRGEGFDNKGKPLLIVYFRVQFYVDEVCLLREKVTRHLYYLQLKENVLKYRHFCSKERCFQLAAFALQADFGNYYPEKHKSGDYFDPRKYFPAWMVGEHGKEYLIENAPKMHKEQHDVTRNEAELKFIRESIKYPAAHNLHFYRLKKKKTDKIWNAWLGICPKGVEIYEEMTEDFKSLLSTFLWPDIEKLYFDKKKFEIRSVGKPEGRKFTYYTDSDAKSKYILSICRNTHMFHLELEPKLMEIRHLQAEDKRRYRESYIYSDARDMVANGGLVWNTPSGTGRGTTGVVQRCSVVSDASSNTTSGIVSDKVPVSFDENEDHGREIIIDSPPRSNVLGTPSQGQNKFSLQPREVHSVPSLSDYMLSAPGSNNRSPKFDSRPIEVYKSTGRAGSSPNSKSASPHSPSSYRGHLRQQPPQPTAPPPPPPPPQQQQQPPPPPPPTSAQQQQQQQQPSPQPGQLNSATPSPQQIIFNGKIPLKYAITGPPTPVISQQSTPGEKSSKPVSRGDSLKQRCLLHVENNSSGEPNTLAVDNPDSTATNLYSLPPPLSVVHPVSLDSRLHPKNMVPLPSVNYNCPSSNQNLPSTSAAIDHIGGASWAKMVALDSISPCGAGVAWGGGGLPPGPPDKLSPSQLNNVWTNNESPVAGAWNKNLTAICTDQMTCPISAGSQWKSIPAAPSDPSWTADPMCNIVKTDPVVIPMARATYSAIDGAPKHVLPDVLLPELPPQRTTDTNLLSATSATTPTIPPKAAPTADVLDLANHTQQSESVNMNVENVTSPSSNTEATNMTSNPSGNTNQLLGNVREKSTRTVPVDSTVEGHRNQAPAPDSVGPVDSNLHLHHPPTVAALSQPQQLPGSSTATSDPDSSVSNTDAKPKSPTKISLKNQKEILHPELEKIRTEANRNSVPFITALFNDHLLLMQHSSSSFCSTDTGTIKSTDSRHSTASNHDMDGRRLSACYPSSTGTMIMCHSTRPYSWHNEKFDLDSQLGYNVGGNGATSPAGLSPSYFNNHHSEPNTLNNFTTPLPTSWTHSIACMPGCGQSLNTYNPQNIASQHMIPARLSCGGHDKNEGSMPHKTLKENIGIA
ncbi:domain-containing 6 [Octopus vulgaris]|uniref:Domain-containing 6 n=1 Tax=Octopus vulgaris TaxID=6645 RepID=A0AA36AU14_OCTVU|nr:domain-containing 6 [Octopus vulgaris]